MPLPFASSSLVRHTSYFVTTTGTGAPSNFLLPLLFLSELTDKKWYNTMSDIVRVPKNIARELRSLSVIIVTFSIASGSRRVVWLRKVMIGVQKLGGGLRELLLGAARMCVTWHPGRTEHAKKAKLAPPFNYIRGCVCTKPQDDTAAGESEVKKL